MKQQYQIVHKKVLTPEISQISVHAPLVAAKAKAGQFIILRHPAVPLRPSRYIEARQAAQG